MSEINNFFDSIVKENPIFSLLLGLVPAVGVTHLASNGLALGLITLIVLIVSLMISLLVRSFASKDIHAVVNLAVVVVITTIMQRVMAFYYPGIVVNLGIYFPLVIVNGVVLYSLAISGKAVSSLIRALGLGCGFILSLTFIGVVREFLGTGELFGNLVYTADIPLFPLATTVPGGFIILGLILAIFNAITGNGGEING